MKGIILAAGRGSRMLRMTDRCPKCLVQVGGKPLLHWQHQAMLNAGIDDILVIRGYRAQLIQGPFQVRDNKNWRQTNMVASLLCAEDWLLHDTCIVSYADIVYPAMALSGLIRTKAALSIVFDAQWTCLWEKRFSDPLSDAESFRVEENGTILEIGQKPVSIEDIQGQYMGLLKFTPESFGWVKHLVRKGLINQETLDMTGLLACLIKNGYMIKGIPWTGPWCEIDTASDLGVAQAIWAANRVQWQAT